MARGRPGWRLTRGGELLATLRPVGRWRFADYPCVEAEFELAAAFEPVRPLFEREGELLDVDADTENAEWLDIWEQLHAPGLFVESADGREKLDVLWVHFKDGRAWWWPLYNSPRSVLGPHPGRPAAPDED